MSCELPGKCGREDIYRIDEDFFLSWPIAHCLNWNTNKRERWVTLLFAEDPAALTESPMCATKTVTLDVLSACSFTERSFVLLISTKSRSIYCYHSFSMKLNHIRIISSPLMYNYVIVLIIVYLLHKLHRGCKYQLTSCWIHIAYQNSSSDRSKPVHCEKKEFTELVIEWLISE